MDLVKAHIYTLLFKFYQIKSSEIREVYLGGILTRIYRDDEIYFVERMNNIGINILEKVKDSQYECLYHYFYETLEETKKMYDFDLANYLETFCKNISITDLFLEKKYPYILKYLENHLEFKVDDVINIVYEMLDNTTGKEAAKILCNHFDGDIKKIGSFLCDTLQEFYQRKLK